MHSKSSDIDGPPIFASLEIGAAFWGRKLAKSPILAFGNSRKLVEQLRPLLGVAAIDVLEREISSQVQKLYTLSLSHYRFALRQPNSQWRQRVSRFYYAAYAASKSIRLYVNGDYSTDTKDHQKVGLLPDDFPQTARFTNQLAILREDRNTCDYDHESAAGDLIIRPKDAETLVKEFLTETRAYLAARGLSLKGAP